LKQNLSSTTSAFIECGLTAIFAPDLSDEQCFSFAFRLDMCSHMVEPVQLLYLRWQTRDLNGVRELDAPDELNGQNAILAPGDTESVLRRCTFSTPIGSISALLTWVGTESGRVFTSELSPQVLCPSFLLN
jgi:uncharacterized protein affecting Mg2+/Co2+ transport